jgi:helicase
MQVIHCGTSGSSQPTTGPTWAELSLVHPWPEIINLLASHTQPRPAQLEAIRVGLLKSRNNLIVSAPTNGGKSLIGTLALLKAIQEGQRAVLLEPLRALAREKFDELQALAPQLSTLLGQPFRVRISTGDIRLEDAALSAPPPGGELLIATPERLEALLRTPSNLPWFTTLGAVCVDEAHLIANPHRGPTLELLIGSLARLPSAPRLVLLSASVGDTSRAQTWLGNCKVVRVTERHPTLEKFVLPLEPAEDATEITLNWCRDALRDANAQVLIFVYQTRSAQRLSVDLTKGLEHQAGPAGALAYHAQQSLAQRENARTQFLSGQSRIMITTTALSMGLNLPVTHVLVRDNTFPGAGRLSTPELLQ